MKLTLKQAFKSQLKNIKTNNITGLKKTDIDITFDEFKNKLINKDNIVFYKNKCDNEVELWKKSKVYFDNSEKIVGDRLLFFIQLVITPHSNDNVKKPSEFNYELQSMPERRISYYEDKVFIIGYREVNDIKKQIDIPVLAIKGTYAYDVYKTYYFSDIMTE